MEVCNFLWIDLDRSSEGNFGGEPPTGSVAYKHWYSNFQLECCDSGSKQGYFELLQRNHLKSQSEAMMVAWLDTELKKKYNQSQ